MTEEEYLQLTMVRPKSAEDPKVSDLSSARSAPNGTLLYGYTYARKTIHLYKMDGQLWLRRYNTADEDVELIEDPTINQVLDQQKRFYSECCSAQIVAEMRARCSKAPKLMKFHERERKQYYGKVH